MLLSAALILGILVPAATPASAIPAGYNTAGQFGFDTCAAPSSSAMNTWWTYTPYYWIGIYIGGGNRACAQPNLTASWIQTQHDLGWSFAPIWVGRQPPNGCIAGRTFGSTISTSAAAARDQGITEANYAINAMWALGFYQPFPIYLDIEGNSGTVNGTCRTVTRSFIDGWSSRLASFGMLSGVYGPCSSQPMDWATIPSPPSAIWIANTSTGYATSNISCVSTGYWGNHQRLKQFILDQYEVWGGVGMNVDVDCANGPVTQRGNSAWWECQ